MDYVITRQTTAGGIRAVAKACSGRGQRWSSPGLHSLPNAIRSNAYSSTSIRLASVDEPPRSIFGESLHWKTLVLVCRVQLEKMVAYQGPPTNKSISSMWLCTWDIKLLDRLYTLQHGAQPSEDCLRPGNKGAVSPTVHVIPSRQAPG